MKKLISLFFVTVFCLSINLSAQIPSLTRKEKKAGWVLLFDGKTFDGWQKPNGQPFNGTGWQIENGVLTVTGKDHGGDIVTKNEFSDFELNLEFKLEKGSNSGIKYFLLKNTSLGCEYQIIDDENHADARAGKNGNRRLASLYDLIPASPEKKVKPLDEWNQVRIIAKGKHVEHWLNGKKVVSYERDSDSFASLIAESKFKNEKGFAMVEKSPILLQEHGDVMHYRNIRIKPLL